MQRLFFFALLGPCFIPASASALELKNVRPSYMALGATRTDVRCVPGDSLFINYDIEGLSIHAKTGRVNYTTKLELVDTTGQVAFQKDSPNDVALPLGGTRMPGDLIVFLGNNQKPGKHKVRLTVTDNLAKVTKAFEYPFEVIAPEFTFVGVSAKSVGFPGESYVTTFALVNMTLDAKKQPNVDIAMRVFDETGKSAVAPQILSNLPKDLPEDIDLKRENFVPMQFPIYLNRSGRFWIEVVAQDKNTKKQIQLRYPLTVIDTAAISR